MNAEQTVENGDDERRFSPFIVGIHIFFFRSVWKVRKKR
jgi:hypothetical protein